MLVFIISQVATPANITNLRKGEIIKTTPFEIVFIIRDIMAEFCAKCFDKMNGTDSKKRKYILSEDLDLCEGCGEWTHVVVATHRYGYMPKLSISFFNIFKKLKSLFRKKYK